MIIVTIKKYLRNSIYHVNRKDMGKRDFTVIGAVMNIMTEDLLDRIIKQKEEIIVYGGGEIARAAMECLIKCGANIQCIAVTNQRNNPLHICGKRVVEIASIDNLKKDSIVLVCTQEKLWDEIGDILNNKGYQQYYGMNITLCEDMKGAITGEEKIRYIYRYITPYLNTIERLCDEYQIRFEERCALIEKGIEHLRTSEFALVRLVVVLGTRCSLRCRDCNNLMPHFKPQKDLDINKIIESLEILTRNVSSILKCEFIGGEPFLSRGGGS